MFRRCSHIANLLAFLVCLALLERLVDRRRRWRSSTSGRMRARLKRRQTVPFTPNPQ